MFGPSEHSTLSKNLASGQKTSPSRQRVVELEDAAMNVMLDAAIQMDHRSQVFVDEARDTNLTSFGKATLTDRY